MSSNWSAADSRRALIRALTSPGSGTSPAAAGLNPASDVAARGVNPAVRLCAFGVSGGTGERRGHKKSTEK